MASIKAKMLEGLLDEKHNPPAPKKPGAPKPPVQGVVPKPSTGHTPVQDEIMVQPSPKPNTVAQMPTITPQVTQAQAPAPSPAQLPPAEKLPNTPNSAAPSGLSTPNATTASEPEFDTQKYIQQLMDAARSDTQPHYQANMSELTEAEANELIEIEE